MKTLFSIAVLIGAIYLVIETEQGHAWIERYIPMQTQENVLALKESTTQSLEDRAGNLVNIINEQQQEKFQQLEERIAKLESKLQGTIGYEANQVSQNDTILPNKVKDAVAALDYFGSAETAEKEVNAKENARIKGAQLREISEAMNELSLQSLSDI